MTLSIILAALAAFGLALFIETRLGACASAHDAEIGLPARCESPARRPAREAWRGLGFVQALAVGLPLFAAWIF